MEAMDEICVESVKEQQYTVIAFNGSKNPVATVEFAN